MKGIVANLKDLNELKKDIDYVENDIYNIETGTKWIILNGTANPGWIHKNTHAIQVQTNSEYITYNGIISGGKYRYSSNGGGNCCAILWLDENENYLSYVDFKASFTYETVEVTAPINAVKAVVNNINLEKGNTKFEYYEEAKKIRTKKIADISDLIETEARLSESITEIANDVYDIKTIAQGEILNGVSKAGWIHKNTHAVEDATNSACEHVTYDGIVGGDKYRYSSNGGGNCCAVLWLDADNNYLSYVDFISLWTYETVEVTAPTNATKAIVNNSNLAKGNTQFEYCKEAENTRTKKIADISDTDFRENSRKSLIINSQLSNDYAWKKPSKLYVSFVFDDTNRDIDLIEDLFESKGVPCCFATVPSRLDNICTNGEKARDVLRRAVANGGEVLSHWHSPLTSASTDEDYEKVIVGAKKDLYNNGFEVNGIIVAGGTGYDSQDFAKDIVLCRPYYKYADLIATGHSDVEQYFNIRQFLAADTSANRGYIDDFIADGVIANKGKDGWIIFASHGTNDGVTVDIISDLLDYIASKGTDTIEIVNCNTAFEKGRSSKLERSIPFVETFVASGGIFAQDIMFRKYGNIVTVNVTDIHFANDITTGWITSNVLPTLPVKFRPLKNARLFMANNSSQFGCISVTTGGQFTLFSSIAKSKDNFIDIYGSYVV